MPPWLCAVLGVSEGTMATLGGQAVWERLPPEAAPATADHVLAVVRSRERALEPVRILGESVAVNPAVLAFASERARNAMTRSGLLTNTQWLENMTFGELLRVRSVGILVALEIAGLLEMMVEGYAGVVDELPSGPRRSGLAWGQPGLSVLPLGLRRALAGERIPAWVREDLHLEEDASFAALDDSIWLRIDVMPERTLRFLLNLAAYRISLVDESPVLELPWPRTTDPNSILWPTRLGNALRRAHLLDPERLEALSYRDLRQVPNLGIRSVLDFAAIGESVTTSTEEAGSFPTDIEPLRNAANEDWAERLRADDPRLRDVAPIYPGPLSTLFEEAVNDPRSVRARRLNDALPAIRARAMEIAEEPLDRGFERLLHSVGSSPRQAQVIAMRIGWNENGPATLQETGDCFGLTRERVRQIAAKYLDRLGPTFLPPLERAIEAIEAASPVPTGEAARLLVKAGISHAPIDPRAVATLADLVGYDAEFHIDEGDGQAWVMPIGRAGTAPIFFAARRSAGRVGVSNLDEVFAGLGGADSGFSEDEVRKVLEGSDKIAFLEDEWFWVPGIPPDRNRLRNVSQRMLAVTPELDVSTLRSGVRRRYRFMRIDIVPPTTVLKAFYTAHPDFVMASGKVRSAVPLDYRLALGDVERAFVDVLRASPTGLLDRSQLEDAVVARGINPNTLAVLLTYSPIIDHPALNVWCLRGAPVDPAQLEAVVAAAASRTRRRRTVAYGWEPDGRLSLTVTIGDVHSPVVAIPKAIARFVAGKRFAALNQEGAASGTVVVDEGGMSWGYGPFLRRHGADEGDPLTIRFDLASDHATLTLGEEEVLVEGHDVD